MITVTEETIGPKEAEELLKLNTHNRGALAVRIASIAEDIKNDNWQLNGETIKISKTNILLDGQNRLHAVLKAGKPITTLVARGLDDGTQKTMDSGSKRRLMDQLVLAGEHNTTSLAGGLRVSYLIDRFGNPLSGGGRGAQPSVSTLLKYFADNPNFRESAKWGTRGSHSRLKIAPSASVALHFQFTRLDATAGNLFFSRLLTGEDLVVRDPIWTLRETLLNDLRKPHRMSGVHRMALMIKAWNYWHQGRKIEVIGWKAGVEAFPKIIAPTE